MPDAKTQSLNRSEFFNERRLVWAAFAVCLVVVLYQTLAPDIRRPVADAIVYANIDAALAEAWLGNGEPDEPPFGIYFAPLYHGFVAAIAIADSGFLKALHCVKESKNECDLSGLTSLFVVQGVLGALSAFFFFMATLTLTKDQRVAWLALMLGLWSKVFSEYASQILAENIAFFFIFLFNWTMALIIIRSSGKGWMFFVAGIALGGAALTRPSYLYLIYFMIVVLLALVFWQSRKWTITGVAVGLFITGAILLPLPWMFRNYLVFETFALTSGQGAWVLIERLAYNTMTWQEFLVSFVYWLPDFGDNLAAALFDREEYIRLSWYHPDSFYILGRGTSEFASKIAVEADAQENALGYMLVTYVVGDLPKHIAVTFALAWRGMFVGRYIALAGLLLLPACWRKMRGSGQAGHLVLYAIPHFFMLGLNAFVSVNVVRYNEPLMVVFTLCISVSLVWAWEASRTRWRRRRPHAD